MTINIQVYQKKGIKTDKIINEFEFCCWEKLKQWLNNWVSLHKCTECVNKIELQARGKT